MANLGRAILEILADASEFFDTLGQLETRFQTTQRRFQTFSRDATAMGGQLTAGLTLPIVGLGAGALKLAVDFESSFAGIGKTVDGVMDTSGRLTEFGARLADDFLRLSTEIPLTTAELNKIGEAAGQLGIETDKLTDFTAVIAKLGVTTDLSSEEAASSLAQLANITQMPQTEFGRLGATIAGLGNNFATTESQIVAFGHRIAGAGKLAGLNEAEILGIGTAMASVGVEAEAGGTAVQKVLMAMTEAVISGGPKLETFAATAGMTAEQFATTWRTTPGDAFAAFVTGLGSQGEQAMFTLGDLELTDQRLMRSFLSLANAGDLVTRSMTTANSEWEKGSALNEEAARRFGTTEQQLVLLWNQVQVVGKELGEALMPILHSTVGVVRELVPYLQGAVDIFTNLPAPVKGGVVALGGLLAALGPVLVILGQIAGAFALVMPYLPALGTAVTTVLGVISGPIGIIGAAVAGLALIWFKWGDDITAAVTGAYRAVKTWLWDNLEPVLRPLGELIQSIGRMFEAFGLLAGAVLRRVLQAHIDMVAGVTFWLVEKLQPLFGPIGTALGVMGTAFDTTKTRILEIVQALFTGVKTWLLDRFTSVVDGIRGKIDAVTGFFQNMYQAVVGGSFVPDMMAGIQAEFGKLPSIMVAPAKSAVGQVEKMFSGMTQNVSNTLSAWGESLTGHIQSTIGGPLGSAFSSIAGGVLNSVSTILTGGLNQLLSFGMDLAIKGVKKIGEAVWSGLKSVGSAIGGAIGSVFGISSNSTKKDREQFAENLGFGNIDDLFDTLRAAGRDDLVDRALNVIGKKDTAANQGWMADVADVLNVPQASTGAFVHGTPRGSLVNVGEFNQDEVVAPTSWLKSLAEPRLGRAGDRFGIYLDGRELIRSMVRHLPDEADRLGAFAR